MKHYLFSIIAMAMSCAYTAASEPRPLLTILGKELLNEDFAGEDIPATFRIATTPESFRIFEGSLEARSRRGQMRSTHGAFAVRGHDLTIAFAVTFVDRGTLFIGVDGFKAAFQGNTHLVRFSLAPDRMAWDEKRGGPESKRAVGEAMQAARAAKRPQPQPTAEQLADASFFRTETLCAKTIECEVGSRHAVLLELSGNELVAQVDGQTLVATATENDSLKSRIGIGLTGGGTVLIDDFRIWENTRREDWPAIKAHLETDDLPKSD